MPSPLITPHQSYSSHALYRAFSNAFNKPRYSCFQIPQRLWHRLPRSIYPACKVLRPSELDPMPRLKNIANVRMACHKGSDQVIGRESIAAHSPHTEHNAITHGGGHRYGGTSPLIHTPEHQRKGVTSGAIRTPPPIGASGRSAIEGLGSRNGLADGRSLMGGARSIIAGGEYSGRPTPGVSGRGPFEAHFRLSFG